MYHQQEIYRVNSKVIENNIDLFFIKGRSTLR